MKIGDKIRCVDAGEKLNITYGEVYEIIFIKKDFIYICDNSGVVNGWYKYRFKNLREDKLIRILNEE